LEPLSAIEGITVFAPNDAAISGLGDALAALNETQVQGILANHVSVRKVWGKSGNVGY